MGARRSPHARPDRSRLRPSLGLGSRSWARLAARRAARLTMAAAAIASARRALAAWPDHRERSASAWSASDAVRRFDAGRAPAAGAGQSRASTPSASWESGMRRSPRPPPDRSRRGLRQALVDAVGGARRPRRSPWPPAPRSGRSRRSARAANTGKYSARTPPGNAAPTRAPNPTPAPLCRRRSRSSRPSPSGSSRPGAGQIGQSRARTRRREHRRIEHKSRKVIAKKAAPAKTCAATCELSAEVTLIYGLEAAALSGRRRGAAGAYARY